MIYVNLCKFHKKSLGRWGRTNPPPAKQGHARVLSRIAHVDRATSNSPCHSMDVTMPFTGLQHVPIAINLGHAVISLKSGNSTALGSKSKAHGRLRVWNWVIAEDRLPKVAESYCSNFLIFFGVWVYKCKAHNLQWICPSNISYFTFPPPGQEACWPRHKRCQPQRVHWAMPNVSCHWSCIFRYSRVGMIIWDTAGSHGTRVHTAQGHGHTTWDCDHAELQPIPSVNLWYIF